jgi:uncharacterized membrane protein
MLRRAVGRMLHRSLTTAFGRWQRTVEEEDSKRKIMIQIFMRMLYWDIGRKFANWALCTLQRQSIKAQAQRVVMKLKSRHLTLAYHRWNDAIAQHMRMKERTNKHMAQIVKRVRQHNTHAAFERWCEHIDECRQHQEYIQRIDEAQRRIGMCKRVVARMLKQQLALAWSTFVECVAERKHNRETIRRVLSRMTHRVLAGTFACYAGAVGTVVVQRERVARTMARWKKPGMKRAMEAWTEYLEIVHGERAQEAQELARQYMQDVLNKEQEKAGLEAERRIGMCKRVVARMLKQQLALAWSTFVECVAERKHNRETIRRVLSRMTHRVLAGTFACYAGAVGTVVVQRERVARTMARWKKPGMKRAMEAWTEYLEIVHGERAQEAQELARQYMQDVLNKEQEKAGLEAERRIGMCKRVVARMLKQQLALAWSTFVECVAERKHNRETIRRVLSRMTHRVLAGTFACYAGAVGTVVVQRERVARTMARWKKPGMKRAMEAWTEYLEIVHGERAQEAQELARQYMQDVLNKEQEKAGLEAERRIGMCKRVVARMLKQQLALAWSTFVECVAERKHNRETIRRVLSRMTHRVLAGTFACYAGAVGTVVVQRERVARTMARWKKPGMKRAMEAWTEYLEIVHGERAQEAQELARQYMQDVLNKEQEKAGLEAERRIGMCKRVVARMLKQQLALAWSTFVECVAERKHNRETIRRVLSRMTHRVLAGTFACYAGAVGTVVVQRERVARTMARWKKPGMKRAMEAWTEYLEIVHGERAQEAQELARQYMQDVLNKEQEKAGLEAERRIGMCKRVVARMLKQQLALAWSTFVECVAERKHNRETIRRVLSRMTHRVLAGTFACYAGAVGTVVVQRERVARTMARWKKPGMKRAMEAWTEYLEIVHGERAQEAQELARQYMQDVLNKEQEKAGLEAERRIGMCKRVVARMLKQQLALAWSTFVECVAERKHNRETIRRVLSRMTHRVLAGTFACYAGAVGTVVVQRERVARTMARWKKPGMKRAMEAWTEYLEIVHGERAQEAQELARQYMQDVLNKEQEKAGLEAERRIGMCKRVVARMLKQQLALAWSTFVECVAERKHNRETIRRVLSRMTHRVLAGTFACYAGAVGTVVVQRERVARTMARWKKPGMKRAMEAWIKKA